MPTSRRPPMSSSRALAQVAGGWRCRSVEPPVTGIAGLDVALRVRGVQYTDGRAEYRLVLSGDGLKDLDPASAREVGNALMAAAEQ